MYVHSTCMFILCMFILCVCSFYVYVHSMCMFILRVCSFYVYVHSMCMFIPCICSFYLYVHSICMFYVYIHSMCIFILCVMFILCVCSFYVYVHSMCMFIPRVCSFYMYVHLMIICILSRYSLKPPSNSEVEKYVDKVLDKIFNKRKSIKRTYQKFSEKFENLINEMAIANRWRSACRIVAKKVVRDNLALRRKLVGELLKIVRSISQQTFNEEAFEEGSHTLSSGTYFCETSYKSPALKKVTVIDRKRNIW